MTKALTWGKDNALMIGVYTLLMLASMVGVKIGADASEATACRCDIGWVTYG